MMNQGPKPTFQDGRRTLEAHLFDFDGNLYGEWVRIEMGGSACATWSGSPRWRRCSSSWSVIVTRRAPVLAAAGPASSRGPMP